MKSILVSRIARFQSCGSSFQNDPFDTLAFPFHFTILLHSRPTISSLARRTTCLEEFHQRWRFKTIVEFYSTTLAHTENNDWKVFFFFFSSDERRKLREFWPVCLCRSKIRVGCADNWKRITSALLYRVPVIKLSFAPFEFPVRHFYESRAIKEPWLISWTSTDQRGKVNIVAAR